MLYILYDEVSIGLAMRKTPCSRIKGRLKPGDIITKHSPEAFMLNGTYMILGRHNECYIVLPLSGDKNLLPYYAIRMKDSIRIYMNCHAVHAQQFHYYKLDIIDSPC